MLTNNNNKGKNVTVLSSKNMVSKCNPSDIFESNLHNVIKNIPANDYFGKLMVILFL
jgi:hypothetical protein